MDNKLPENYTFRPLPGFIELRKSEIEGYGLFAKETIAEGVDLGASHINLFCTEFIYDSKTMDYLQEQFPNYLVRTPLGGYINHDSINPNVRMENCKECLYKFISTRNIQKGEELTINYHTTPCSD